MTAKNNTVLTANKAVPFIYRKMHAALQKKAISGKISFSDSRSVLASQFRISKTEYFSVLKELENFGLVKIEAYHHIKMRRFILNKTLSCFKCIYKKNKFKK